jgi:hypothetical protein
MTGQEVFRARRGRFVEVWHQEDLPTSLTQLGLQPPPAVMRLAAHASAWRFKRASLAAHDRAARGCREQATRGTRNIGRRRVGPPHGSIAAARAIAAYDCFWSAGRQGGHVRSDVEQETKGPTDIERDRIGHRTEPSNESLLGDGLHHLALRVARILKPGTVRLDLDVRGQPTMRGRCRNDDHDAGAAVIERVSRYHDRWAAA